MDEYRISNFRIFTDDEVLQKYDIQKVLKLGSIYYNILLADPKTHLVAAERMKIPISPVVCAFIKENKGKIYSSNLYFMDKEVYRMYKLQKAINGYLLNKPTREANKIRAIEKNITSLEKEMPSADMLENESSSSEDIVSETLNIKEMIDVVALVERARLEKITLQSEESIFFISRLLSSEDSHSIELQFSCRADEPVAVSTLLCKIHYGGKVMSIEYPNQWRYELFHSALGKQNELINIGRRLLNNHENGMNLEKKDHKKSKKIDSKNFDVIQMKVSVKGIHPPIWRRVLVSENMALDNLHLVIQAAFGWSNLGYYSFNDGYDYYSRPVDREISDDIDSTETRLFNIVFKEGQTFTYSYDIDVEWGLIIRIEKIFKHEPSMKLPACIAGRRNSPDENWDPMEYDNIIRAINNHENSGSDDSADRDSSYDPEKFDRDATDSEVKNYKNLDNSDLMY